MISAIRSEVRKILTVRSTYAIILLCIVLEAIASGYGGGFNAPREQLADPNHLINEVSSVVNLLSAFMPLIGILLVTQEFRYNTISYTLTAARNRTTVLLSKVAVISALTLLLAAIFMVLSPLFVWIGTSLNGRDMVSQHMFSGDLIWRLLFTAWGYGMIGLVISLIARIQVAALVAYFLIPGPVEGLLGLLLKDKREYLPYTSVDGVINQHAISHGASAVAALVWIVSGMLLAWLLFKRRDAS